MASAPVFAKKKFTLIPDSYTLFCTTSPSLLWETPFFLFLSLVFFFVFFGISIAPKISFFFDEENITFCSPLLDFPLPILSQMPLLPCPGYGPHNWLSPMKASPLAFFFFFFSAREPAFFFFITNFFYSFTIMEQETPFLEEFYLFP